MSQPVVTGELSDAIDRRRYDRPSSLVRAIIVQVGQAPIHCAIIDLTEIGAKLSSKDAFLISGEFQVEIPLRDVVKFARVVWRRAEMIGIEFLKECSSEATEPEKETGIDQTVTLLREIRDRLAKIEQSLGVAKI
jgi:PilZ domain